ncbi:MAG TPA: hypothetical protein VHR65_02475 [Solirubrobacterales bacterium]|jgi:hypothetical protein|nr:hypothetical protein [Solirubrobacterales bacterium]
MSSIAVFLILGGATAFAAKKIGSNEIKGNSITTGKLKKGAVTTSKIKKDAVTGAKVKESSLGQVPSAALAANAEKLGGVLPSGYEGKIEWALISKAGAVIQQSGGISAVENGAGFGTYNVKFPDDVSNKALSVTLSDIDAAFGGAPIVSPCAGPGQVGSSLCGGDTGNGHVAFVDTPNQANSSPVAHAFYIQASP